MKMHTEDYANYIITIHEDRGLHWYAIETEAMQFVSSSGYFRLFSHALEIARDDVRCLVFPPIAA